MNKEPHTGRNVLYPALRCNASFCNNDARCFRSCLSHDLIVVLASLQVLHVIFPGKSKDELKIPLKSAGDLLKELLHIFLVRTVTMIMMINVLKLQMNNTFLLLVNNDAYMHTYDLFM